MSAEMNKRIMELDTMTNLIESDELGFRQLSSEEILQIAYDAADFWEIYLFKPIPSLSYINFIEIFANIGEFLMRKKTMLSQQDQEKLEALVFFKTSVGQTSGAL